MSASISRGSICQGGKEGGGRESCGSGGHHATLTSRQLSHVHVDERYSPVIMLNSQTLRAQSTQEMTTDNRNTLQYTKSTENMLVHSSEATSIQHQWHRRSRHLY